MGISVQRIGQRVMGAAVVAVMAGLFAAGGAQAATSSESVLADVTAGVQIDLSGIGVSCTAARPEDDRWT
ncbi:hypothetical protein [Streptomyces vietnamensis]|uniref:Uncharacterized protein n=1 Tax=Streptomyces vietnamensis TaxID=362257 RepID=A0A0B5I214_9ACTN|nr:hypothetical protein [Streptomyces vietnamensis]AJF63668.1 hypothetical protein SVTN_03495 [Streptomyces vietnamensis]